MKTGIYCIRVGGGEGAGGFQYDDVMPRFQARSSAAHTIQKHNARKQTFLDMEKRSPVFENAGLCVEGQIRFENATCGRRFFKYEKKYPFSKLPSYM